MEPTTSTTPSHCPICKKELEDICADCDPLFWQQGKALLIAGINIGIVIAILVQNILVPALKQYLQH